MAGPGRVGDRVLRGFQRLSFAVPGPNGRSGRGALDAAFAVRNLRLADIDDRGELRLRIAQLPQMAFAHASAPPLTLEWPRDELSADRAILIVVSSGEMAVDSAGAVWRAEPGLFLVPPGQSRVTFRVTEPSEEIFFITASRAVLRDVDIPSGTPRGESLPIQEEALPPMLGFIRALVDVDLGADGSIAVHNAATSVIRSLAWLMREAARSDMSVYEQAKDVILRSFAHPGLAAADLAGAVGVSERTLRAAFAEHDTTAMRELRRVRTRVALTTRGEHPGIGREALARTSGFGSVSSMLRAMRSAETDVTSGEGGAG